MTPLKLSDSRGKESRTLLFVTIAFVVVVIKFLLSGLVVPGVIAVPIMNGYEFGAAVGAVLAVWIGREHTEKKYVLGRPQGQAAERLE